MSVTMYTSPNAPTAVFAEKDGKWFSLRGHTVAALAAKPATVLDEVNLAIHPALRRIAATI